MKRIHHYLAGLGILAAGQAAVHAQTVTVAKSGTPDFPTVQAAVASFIVDPNPSVPNVVEITDSEVYDEILTINASVSIRGTASERPVLAVQANPLGRNASGGIVISVPPTETTSSVQLKNLVIVPSRFNVPQSTALENTANNVYVELDNILLTGNDGTDAPVSKDGLIFTPDNPAYYHFGDDGIVLGISEGGQFEGSGVELRMVDTVVTHLRGASGSVDGLTFVGTMDQYRLARIDGGCVFSWNSRTGMNFSGGDIRIDGSDKPVRSMYNGQYGVVILGPSPNVKMITGLLSHNNNFAGVYENAVEGVRLDLSNSIIAHNNRQNLWLLGAATGEVKVTSVTLANTIGAAYNTLRLDATLAAHVTISDSIIAGNGSANAANVIYNYGLGNLTLENTAVVTEGPYALLAVPIDGPGGLVGTPVTNANPQFDAIGYAFSDYFFDIKNTAYATLATDGGPLSGGADYVGAASPGAPVTVTVAKSGTPDHSSIAEAIDAMLPLHPDAPKTIEITDSAVYDEEITVPFPVNIVGEGAGRPVIAVRANRHGYDVAGTTNGYGGLVIGMPFSSTTGTVALRNLVVIPSSTDTTQPLVAINNYHNNVYLEIDNLLISGNNGSDAPISVDGLSLVDSAPAHVHFKLSGIVLGSATAGRLNLAGAELHMKDTVVTNLRGTTGTPGTGLTGFANGVNVQRPSGFRMTTILDGCVVSYGGGTGLVLNSELNVYAPVERLLVLGNGFNGISFDNSATVIKRVDGANVLENNTGIFDNAQAGMKATLVNVISANNRAYNVWYRRGTANALIENATIAKPGAAFGTLFSQTGNGAYTGTVTLKNSIVGGSGDTTNTANIINAGKIVLEGTAVVTDGPFALNAAAPYQAAAVVTGTPTTNADPEFVETFNPLSENLFDVTNTAYATANATGGPLGGGADYDPAASVSDWNVY